MTSDRQREAERVRALTTEQRKLLRRRLAQRQRETPAAGRIPARVDRGTAPLTLDQQFLWFVNQLSPGAPAYNINYARHLSGHLDFPAFERSIAEIIRRHDTLRTTFAVADGQPIQIIHEPDEVASDINLEDLSHLSGLELETRLDARLGELANAPFDLEHGPLVRVNLLRTGSREHVLLVTIHHIVTDRLSFGVLEHELSHLYAAHTNGVPPTLPELPIQYGDFAAWQRAYLQGGKMDTLAAFWRRELEGAPLTLELPTDHDRPPVPSLRGRRHDFQLERQLQRRLKAVANDNGVSPFVLHLAAFGILLHRYSTQERIVIGSPVANRERPETQGLIGYLLNVLPIRVDLDGNPRIDELLARVRRTAVGALAHHEMPLGKMIELLQPERDFSRNPVVQTSLIYVEATARGLELPGVTVRPQPVDHRGSRFDLSLAIIRSEDALDGFFEYSTDLFDATTIERMVGQYRTLLEALCSGADRPLSSLGMVSTAERDRVLVDWNETTTPYPREACIHGLFEAQAAQTPDAVAVEFAGETLTYDALNRRANQVAHHLIGLAVGPEVKVGIALERSVEMVVGILGVLKAGGAYVPLDPAYPAARLSFMMQDTQAPVVLTQAHLEADLPEHDGTVMRLDADWSRFATEPETNPASGATAPSLAYVMYTSGSTGRPKGVCVTHRSVIRLVRDTNYLTVDPSDVFLQFAPISFDASTLELWGSLLNGAKLVVSAPQALSLEEIGRAVKAHGITTLWLTGALFQQMVNEQPDALAGVRQLLAGGDVLSVPHVRRMIERLAAGHSLINGYGPTENTTFTCCHVMGQDSVFARSVPIGRPIANTTAYLLDANLEPVPVGVPGELYVGGVGVARGYLNRPALTAERFMPDPFGGGAGARLYRTGDLVRYLPDGNIAFLGRVDDQVKLRGYRIEPGEIEAALRRHDAVREAVVRCREDEPSQKRLVAYVVTADGGAPAAALRAHLRETLPEYMIPSAFVHLETLPVTPSGKVDHRALPAPEGDRQVEEAYVAPRNEVEAKIAAIWRDVLGAEHVGVHDSFFDLGGHSLQLVQVYTRMRDEAGCELSVTDLFQLRTVAEIAENLRGAPVPKTSLSRMARNRVERRASAAGNEIAVIGMAGRFPGATDVETLWTNVAAGVESIRFFTDEELRAAGVDEATLRDPGFVNARGALDGVELFDARHFGYTPREAELIDPQQRIFLECAWHALERAGYDPERYDGLIGMYAGASSNAYFANVQSRPELVTGAGLAAVLSADKDFLPTRVSYKLNLRGPSMNIQTACSTSLVAVHEACRSLIDRQCDIALAGGVSVSVPAIGGYLHREGDIGAPDGHCRTFDARAKGTLRGNGAGIVVLKRLDDALRDGDAVHAVILGTAVNNDGSNKAGYTAPSVEGQAEVVAMAQAAAGVDPETITYIEAHGTATPLGDPIEVAALTRVFREHTERTGFCGLSSLKSNIGHLDAAAGVAGLIKAVLALEHRTLPPSLHFERPNPEIDFEKSPFYVITERREWDVAEGVPRRAGVSAFGLGGTNAHAVLEEAPAPAPSDPCEGWQLVVLSAKDEDALDVVAADLAAHLGAHRSVNLADVAYTLQVGRRELDHRRAVRCRDVAEAIAALSGDRPDLVDAGHVTPGARPDARLEDLSREVPDTRELARLWVRGTLVDWSRVHGKARRRRVKLPAYPFRRERYWIEPRRCPTAAVSAATPARRANLAEWFYVPYWHRSRPPRRSDSTSPILVFARDDEFDRRIVASLEESGRPVAVVRAGGCSRGHGGAYVVDPRSPAEYARLLDTLRAGPGLPSEVVHLWTLSFEAHRLSTREVEVLDERGLRALLHFARAFESLDGTAPLRIDVVTDGAQDVTGRDLVQPEKATVLGFCRILPLELPGMTCRAIDLATDGSARKDALARHVAQECLSSSDDAMVAFRDGCRRVQSFARIELGSVEVESPGRLRNRGVYLVTGGLGGMGLELAGELARAVQARLILTGRTGLPARCRWAAHRAVREDPIGAPIRAIEAMEAAGAEVMIGEADVTDLDRMRAVVAAATERFGKIDGVLHMAGVSGGGATGRAGADDLERTCAPKVRGVRVLERLFREERLDFMVLASSLITAWGVPGWVDYCAANMYLDAFARRFRADAGVPTVAIGWTRWHETGMAREQARASAMTSQGISTQEGIEAFRRIIDRCDEPHVLVSDVDFRDAMSSPHRNALAETPAGGRTLPNSAPERHTRPKISTGYEAPRTDAEKTLAAIWQDLLGIDQIGIHDNFFELGGDSVLGIQVVWRAKDAGFVLGPNSLFEYQTIGELAAATMASSAPVVAEQGPVTGDVPHTPIQRWFLERNFADAHHFNLGKMLAVRTRLSSGQWQDIVRTLLEHHDALRLRWVREGGAWRQRCAVPGGPVPLEIVDFTTLAETEHRPAIESRAAELQTSLDLANGPIVRFALFDLGAAHLQRLLIIVHHLAFDAVSWPILLQNLAHLVEQVDRGEAAALPAKTTSFQVWARRLVEHARSAAVTAELTYWSDLPWLEVSALPIDHPAGCNTMETSASLNVALDEDATRQLLLVQSTGTANVHEVLLAALTKASASWTGNRTLLIDVEAHGREPLFDDVDLTRTIGWFTSMHPVLLSAAAGAEPASILRSVQERLHAVPGHGIGYGLLRYLHSDDQIRQQLAARPLAQVSFLGLGQTGMRGSVQVDQFLRAEESTGRGRSPRARRSHLLAIASSLDDGRLGVKWNYSTAMHQRATIQALAEDFAGVLRDMVCRISTTSARYSAATLSDGDLAKIALQIRGEASPPPNRPS